MIKLNDPKFPSVADPTKGSVSWIKKYTKACWDDFKGIQTNSFYSGRKRYDTIKSYMFGKQDMAPYFDMLDVNTANKDKQWLKYTKKPLPIVPKFRRMAISTLIKNNFEIELSAIDPISLDESKDYYSNQLAIFIARKEAEAEGVPPELFGENDRVYATEEELELHMMYAYKHQFAMEGEMAIELILNNSNHEEDRAQAIEMLHDTGFIGYEDYIDANGDIKTKSTDVRNVVVSRCQYPDFSDSFYRGEVLDLSIGDIKKLDVNNELTEKDYLDIEEQLGAVSRSFETNENVAHNDYESRRVQVLRLEFDEAGVLVREKGVNSVGNPVSTRRRSVSEVKKGNDVEVVEYPAKYVSNWVIGTDKYFGCELQTNMKRPKDNLSDVQSRYHWYAPMLDDMETLSMGESYITIADSIQIAFMKYFDVILTAKKNGIAIEIGALENIPLGDAGKKYEPMDAFDFYKKTGSVIYRRTSPDGAQSSWKPIEELNNGLGTQASAYFAEIQNGIMLLQQQSGYNELTDGSTPDERTLNGVAKQAAESTNNSIDFMKRAERFCFESLCTGLLMRVQDSATNGNIKGYVSALGKGTISFFELNPEISSRQLGIKVKNKPSQYEVEKLNERINIALQANQITIADTFVIENIPNLKQAEGILVSRVKRQTDRQQEINLQNQEMNAKVQQESTMVASQVKQQEVQVETQAKLAILEAEKAKELELLDKKYSYELQLKEMEVTGRIQQNKLQADAKIYGSDRDAKTKQEMHESQIQSDATHKMADMEMEKEKSSEKE